MVAPSEKLLWEVAARQSGYLTRRQALACGMSEAMIIRRIRTGGWKKVKPGLYLLPGHLTTSRGVLAAASAALGAVVSHQSAAEIHDLPHVVRGLAVVTVPIRTTNRFPGVIVHQSTDLTSEFVTETGLFPITNLVRTVIDLAAIMPLKHLDRLVDRCLADGRLQLEEVREKVELLARQGKPGITKLRKVLELRQPGYVPSESALESLMLQLLREWDFPEPTRQHPLPWRTPRAGRIDFAYPEARLLIEVDGRSWHALFNAFDEDRLRDNHAQLAGWKLLRITYRMLHERRDEVRRLIALAFDEAA